MLNHEKKPTKKKLKKKKTKKIDRNILLTVTMPCPAWLLKLNASALAIGYVHVSFIFLLH